MRSRLSVAHYSSMEILDVGTKAWNGVPPRGMDYWERVDDVIQREPIEPRDTFFHSMLRPLGLEKGKPFKPDARQKKSLTDAALVGEAMGTGRLREELDPDRSRQELVRVFPVLPTDRVLLRSVGAIAGLRANIETWLAEPRVFLRCGEALNDDSWAGRDLHVLVRHARAAQVARSVRAADARPRRCHGPSHRVLDVCHCHGRQAVIDATWIAPNVVGLPALKSDENRADDFRLWLIGEGGVKESSSREPSHASVPTRFG
jgi:hypothetical protein